MDLPLSDSLPAPDSASTGIGVAPGAGNATDLDAIRTRLRRLGALACHEHRVLRLWSNGLPQASGKRRPEDLLPKALLNALPAIERDLAGLVRLRSAHASADGAERLLIDLHDGRTVETVLLPGGGLCVSTQVGCAVGCVFCTTGLGGLERQLGSAEIVAQVALARGRRPVRKLVLMGMGEPAHNLEAVLDAIALLGSAGGLAHRGIVFSTVGDRRAFDRLLVAPVRPALAISLHSTDPALRARLLPRAPRLAPDELVDFGERHARATGHPVQMQWALLDGINDGPDEVDGIVRLLHGRRAMINLIPYNEVDGLALRRPPAARAEAVVAELRRRGIVATLRRSAGQDVEAGCGQLRARAGIGPEMSRPIRFASGVRRPGPQLPVDPRSRAP